MDQASTSLSPELKLRANLLPQSLGPTDLKGLEDL
jgi:hypothetical protein